MQTKKPTAKRNNCSFTSRVRSVVAAIPPGSVLTYAEVARAAGSPYAVRAVGSVMAKNHDAAIPCHRVVRSDGRPGGFNRGGEVKKRRLLQREGVII